MQATLNPAGSPATPPSSRRALTILKALLALSALCIAGGAVWYVAVTGVVGKKDWDFIRYGLAPAITCGAGFVLLLGTLASVWALMIAYVVIVAIKKRGIRPPRR